MLSMLGHGENAAAENSTGIRSSPLTTTKKLPSASPHLPPTTTSSSVQNTKQIFMKPPTNYSSHTGVQDWEELADNASGRVFFFSESRQISQWGLPLESVGKTEQERQKLRGWCLHIDPTTQNKYFAHEAKARAQWNYPGEGLKAVLWKVPYLRDKRSWAVDMHKKHNRPKPAQGSSLQHMINPNKPAVGTLTLRELVQSLTLNKVVCDREAFKALQIFAASVHAEDNVLAYCSFEVYRTRSTKAVGVLGLDDLAKPNDKGLPRTQSHLDQIHLDQIKAERCGTSVERVQMLREAQGIYNRFMCEEAKDWIFINPVLVDEVASVLAECREEDGGSGNPTATSRLNRSLFDKAQSFVFQNLEQDLLPRFLKAALTREPAAQSAAGGDNEFVPDEVLRHHLLQLQRKPDHAATLLMSTANAYRSLFPSPRYAIEGREGSGLSPFNLGQDAQDADERAVVEHVLPPKKTFNIVGRMLFPQTKPTATTTTPPPQQQQKHVLLTQPEQVKVMRVVSAAAAGTTTGGEGEDAAVQPMRLSGSNRPVSRVNRLSVAKLGGELNLDLETFDVAH